MVDQADNLGDFNMGNPSSSASNFMQNTGVSE